MNPFLKKMRKSNFLVLMTLVFASLFVSCGKREATFQKSALDELVKTKNDLQNFSVILYDMDFDEKTERYKHQYQLLIQPNSNPDTLINELQPWVVVSDVDFKSSEIIEPTQKELSNI